jgi:hypothetical protein
MNSDHRIRSPTSERPETFAHFVLGSPGIFTGKPDDEKLQGRKIFCDDRTRFRSRGVLHVSAAKWRSTGRHDSLNIGATYRTAVASRLSTLLLQGEILRRA